jgi:HK97 family phage major capsid protein
MDVAMTLKELQDKRSKLVHDAREALNEINKNTDLARAAELEKRHDDFMGELDKIDADIAREQRMAAAEERIAKAAEEERKAKRPTGEDTAQRGQSDGNKAEYREVFHKFLAAGASLDALDSEERKVLRAGVVADMEKRVQTGGTNTAGGYTIPVELQDMLVRSMKAWGPMYDGSIVSELNTSSGNALPIPTTDDTGNSGVAGTEGTALTDDGSADATFGQKQLEAYDFNTKFVKFSWQLAQDSIFSWSRCLPTCLASVLAALPTCS